MKFILKVLLFIAFYIFWVMGSLAVIFGVFTDPETQNISPLAIVVYLVVILIPVALFSKLLTGTPRWTKKVLAEGKSATATVISSKYAGYSINRTYYNTLKLHIEPPDDTPFDFTVDKPDYEYGRMSTDTRLAVKYDPQHKKHVVIVGSADSIRTMHYDDEPKQPADWTDDEARKTAARKASQAGHLQSKQAHNHDRTQLANAPDIGAELYKLAEMHKNGDLTDEEFDRAKKKILG
jgi:uncharacterized membrane protein